MTPSFLYGFSDGTHANTTFGSDMGIVNGTEAGRKLMRGSWNAQAWGALYTSYLKGSQNGTDHYFNKSMNSSASLLIDTKGS